jgi:hypothetical protein
MRVVFACGFKEAVAIAVLGCLIGGGCSAVTARDDIKSEQTLLVSVNRTNKGDQLAATSTSTSTVHASSASSTAMSPASRKRPPLGCDAAFSSIADPIHANVYKRCAA